MCSSNNILTSPKEMPPGEPYFGGNEGNVSMTLRTAPTSEGASICLTQGAGSSDDADSAMALATFVGSRTAVARAAKNASR